MSFMRVSDSRITEKSSGSTSKGNLQFTHFQMDQIAQKPLIRVLKCVIANTSARAFYATHGWIEVGSGNSDQGPFVLLERRSGPSRDASLSAPSSFVR